jgi:FkbM family methyltransferase
MYLQPANFILSNTIPTRIYFMPRINPKLERALYPSLIRDVPRVQGPGFQSQDGQDRFLVEKIFAGKHNGVFVDVGANDGKNLSNTWYFEKELGWSGLAIEPIPSVFNKLRENRSCTTVNCCVADHEGSVRFLELTGYTEMLSGMLDSMDARHLERIEQELAQHGGSKQTITLPCRPLRALLSEQSITSIDYLSIDTEGSELEVLYGIDFSKTAIDVISIENNFTKPDIHAYLETKNFMLIARAGLDEIYRKEPRQKDELPRIRIT